MNTVQDKWKGFSEAVMPKDASDIQTQEMKRSFYAGAFSMFSLMKEISDQHSEETAAKMLDTLDQESQAFFKQGVG